VIVEYYISISLLGFTNFEVGHVQEEDEITKYF